MATDFLQAVSTEDVSSSPGAVPTAPELLNSTEAVGADPGHLAAPHRRDTDEQRSTGWSTRLLLPVVSLKKAVNKLQPSEQARRDFRESRHANRAKVKGGLRALHRSLTPRNTGNAHCHPLLCAALRSA